MKKFDNITLVCIDCHNYIGAILAIQRSLQHASFKSVKFITDLSMVSSEFETVIIDKIKSKEEYSEFVIKELYKYFDTDYVWIIQHDGYILNTDVWTDDFLKYDGIGAKWLYVDGRNNFNGGFSIRSKKLQTVIATDPMIQVFHPEDSVICRLYRHYLEHTHNIKFPPDELCDRFAYELHEPCQTTVGFHGLFHFPYKKCVVIRRMAAMGDVIQVEPVLRYFYNKGYRVYLDTLEQFFYLFMQHEYRVDHFSNINPNMPYELIDLDMSYEANPKRLHLKSYYEAAGISDGPIVNPRLTFNIDDSNKLFKKYAVLHIDKRGQGGRNVYGVDWDYVCFNYLSERGYTVIQVGEGESPEVKGAIKMKAATLNVLMCIVAGCDLFIGIDSGVANIAAAFDRKMVVFHGNVNPAYIWPNMDKIKVLSNHEGAKVCNTPYCWHNVVNGTEGKVCYINEYIPPCAKFETTKVLDAIKEII